MQDQYQFCILVGRGCKQSKCGGTCFGVMTSNFQKIKLGQNLKNGHISDQMGSYSFPLTIFIKTPHCVISFLILSSLLWHYHCDLINFLKILRSWPQNKYNLCHLCREWNSLRPHRKWTQEIFGHWTWQNNVSKAGQRGFSKLFFSTFF